MRFLDISAEVGPGAPIATLERLVRGIRVAVDVARDADMRRARRIAENQMRFPTDHELAAAIERFPDGSELGPRHRAELQLDARQRLRKEVYQGPPEFWLDSLYRRGRSRPKDPDFAFREAGFERLLSAMPIPIFSGAVGLDALDPQLYEALVAEAVARQMPGAVRVRQLRYENPFFTKLVGKGAGERSLTGTAQLIETVGTLGSRRKVAKAEAEVAERTVDQLVEESELDLELKRLKVARERQALIADQIANARAASELGGDRVQESIMDAARRRGLLDIADAVGDLTPSDAAALGELAPRRLELVQHDEDDDDDLDGGGEPE